MIITPSEGRLGEGSGWEHRGRAMIVFLCGLLLAMLSASPAPACTSVPATVDGQVWIAANSPYCVSGDLRVGSLTIQPGVDIVFLGNYQLEVVGVLTAIGTEQDSIRFMPADSVASWKGMYFENIPQSELAYCRLLKADNSAVRILNSTPNFRHCTFGQSSSGSGGGLHVELTDPALAIRIEDCEILENTSSGHAGGMYLSLTGSSARLDRCSFRGNVSNPSGAGGGHVGGAMQVENAGGIVELNDCSFRDNACRASVPGSDTGLAYGGGLYLHGDAIVRYCSFLGNAAHAYNYSSSGGYSSSRGGGLYVHDGSVVVINSIFGCNTTDCQYRWFAGEPFGSGLYVNGGSVTLRNCDVVENNLTGIHRAGGTVTVGNSIVYFNNSSGEQFAGPVAFTYSDVQNLSEGLGIIDQNPGLMGEGCQDWHLLSNSPCIDAGSPDVTDNDVCLPPSLRGARNDMGAYGGPGACGVVPDDLTVLEVSPAPESAEVDLRIALSVRFGEAIDDQTLNAANWVVTGDSTGPVVGVITPSANGGSFQPTQALHPGERVRSTLTRFVLGLSTSRLAVPYSWDFVVADPDTICPIVATVAPDSGAAGIAIGTSLRVVFSEAVASGSLTAAGFHVTGSRSGTHAFALTPDGTSAAVLDPQVGFQSGERVTCQVLDSVQDVAGNALDGDRDGVCGGAYEWSFLIEDVESPRVLLTHPADGATDVPAATALTVRFSEPIDVSTLASGWTVSGSRSGPVAGQIVALAPDSASFVPDEPFIAGDVVTAVLTAAVADSSGNPLDGDGNGTGGDAFAWSFTTAVTDTTCPTIASVTPAPGARNVPAHAAIQAALSEPVVPTTVNMTVTGSVSGPVSGSSTLSPNSVATFTPSQPFRLGETVTVRVSESVTDMAGNHLDGNGDRVCGDAYEWAFTVERGDTTVPHVDHVSPRQGANDVPAQTALGVRFSKPILAATLNNTTWTVTGSVSHAAVPGQIRWVHSDSATFQPASPFRAGEEVTATLAAAITDTLGHHLDGNGDGQGGDAYSWRFRVAGAAPIEILARDEIPAGRYLMMSLPVRLDQGTHLSTAFHDLGAPGPYTWRGFGMADVAYVEDPVIEPGQSFFLAVKREARPTFHGFRLADSIAVALRPGWNLVGCIDDGTRTYPWSRCLVIAGGVERPFSEQGYVQRAVAWYEDDTGDLRNNGLWQTLSGDPLFREPPERANPWGGYLLEASVPCTLVFREQTAGLPATKTALNGGPPHRNAATDDRAARAASTGDWSIRLYAEADGTRDGWLELGVQSDAGAGRDDHDVRKPPSLGDGVRLAIVHEDWPDKSAGEYLTDIRGPGEMSYEWDLTMGYVGDRKNEDTARMIWQDVGGVPAEWNIYLVTGGSQAVDMRTTNRYDLLLRAGEPRQLAIRVSKDRWPGEIVEAGLSHIVAIGPSPAATDVTVELRIGQAGPVDLTVFDIQGRVVDRLVRERREPGQYTLTWSPARSGVVSGVYFVKLRTPAGNDTRRVVVVRG